MEKTYIIRLTSGKHTLEIAPDAPCRLLAGGLIGFDCTGLDVSVRPYASRNGGYPERRRFAERELGLIFEIDADEEETEAIRRRIVTMRRRMASVSSPSASISNTRPSSRSAKRLRSGYPP